MKNFSRFICLILPILLSALSSCTDEEIPILTTAEVTGITTTSAITGGNVISDGGADIVSRGVCWNTSGSPTIANQKTTNGTGTGSFNSSLTLLIPKTYYYLRAYATNSAGTGYGNELSFSTSDITTGSVSDIDGNTYKTVVIGTQTWMSENLKTTRYNDNTSIPLVTENAAWKSLISPAYCWYNNDASTYKSDYGALYNWYTAATGKLCPSGWRVPTDGQWSTLSTYLGGEDVAGDKMKETGTAHWTRYNGGVTNESGFTALPGGGRVNGTFDFLGRAGAWWSATEYDVSNAWCRELDDDVVELLRGKIVKSQGYSVRCIKQ